MTKKPTLDSEWISLKKRDEALEWAARYIQEGELAPGINELCRVLLFSGYVGASHNLNSLFWALDRIRQGFEHPLLTIPVKGGRPKDPPKLWTARQCLCVAIYHLEDEGVAREAVLDRVVKIKVFNNLLRPDQTGPSRGKNRKRTPPTLRGAIKHWLARFPKDKIEFNRFCLSDGDDTLRAAISIASDIEHDLFERLEDIEAPAKLKPYEILTPDS